jgi:ABC-type dipeptide/oligopeptide/nickel transport system permease subunit
MNQPAASPERFRHLRASFRLWGETLRALARSPGAVAGGVLFTLIIGMSLCFQIFYTKDPLAQDLLARLTPPFWQEGGSLAYPLGTDNLGRDVLVRILYGSRWLMVGSLPCFAAGLASYAHSATTGWRTTIAWPMFSWPTLCVLTSPSSPCLATPSST